MRRSAGIAFGGVFVIATAAATAAVNESATVVLRVPAQRVEASLTLTGSPTEGVLRTQILTASASDSLARSGIPATVPADYATGDVVFSYYSACTRFCAGVTIRVPLGSVLSTAAGVQYVTLVDRWLPPTANVSLPSSTSQPTPVRAVLPGPSGNTGAGTVVNFDYNQAPGLVVTNPKAIAGGTNRETHVVSLFDFNVAVQDATADAMADAKQAMRAKAGAMRFVLVQPPSTDVTSSDAVGAEAETFTVTVTASLEAVAFFDRPLRGRVEQDVLSRVRAGQRLTRDSIETDYRIVSARPDGEMTVSVTAIGFVVPDIATQRLQWRIAGLPVAHARAALAEAVPQAGIDIQTWPAGVSLLPTVPDKIAIRVETLPARA